VAASQLPAGVVGALVVVDEDEAISQQVCASILVQLVDAQKDAVLPVSKLPV